MGEYLTTIRLQIKIDVAFQGHTNLYRIILPTLALGRLLSPIHLSFLLCGHRGRGQRLLSDIRYRADGVTRCLGLFVGVGMGEQGWNREGDRRQLGSIVKE